MKVVVAIDSPQSAKTALEYLSNGKYGAKDEIHLIHVIVPGFADVAVQGIPDVVGQEKQSEQKLLAETSEAIKSKLNAVVTTDILNGDVAQVIADACKRFDADETIVPSHARHGFSRIWFGSIADEIVDAAPCTVIVLKMAEGSKR